MIFAARHEQVLALLQLAVMSWVEEVATAHSMRRRRARAVIAAEAQQTKQELRLAHAHFVRSDLTSVFPSRGTYTCSIARVEVLWRASTRAGKDLMDLHTGFRKEWESLALFAI